MNQEMASITHFTYGDVLKSVPNNISYYLFRNHRILRCEDNLVCPKCEGVMKKL